MLDLFVEFSAGLIIPPKVKMYIFYINYFICQLYTSNYVDYSHFRLSIKDGRSAGS